MNEGDIYSWCYKDENRLRDNHPLMANLYHCKSQIAVYRGGALRDTFWSDTNGDPLSIDDVHLEFLGNANEMRVVSEFAFNRYKRSDIVDTRHPNNSSAAIYLKPGAKMSADVMREYAQHAIDQHQVAILSSQRSIARMEENLQSIDRGELDQVCF